MKLILSILFFVFFVSSQLTAQDIVSQEPQLRNAVIEEFTGIHCGNCPGGHQKAGQLAEDYPGRVALIGYHEGYYAEPYAGQPDFRTELGPAILAQALVSGFPAATVNRQLFGPESRHPYFVQKKGGMAMSATGWRPAAIDSVLNGTMSPVNIGARTSWNNDLRELKVEVELFFTEAVGNDVMLNIALTESHIMGPQTGAPDPNNYEHNHVFRDFLTGQWGELINETDKSKLFKKTYTYTVSSDINILNCDLVLFVSDDQRRNIYTGIETQIIKPNVSMNITNGSTINIDSQGPNSATLEFVNLAADDKIFHAEITAAENAPEDWDISLSGGDDISVTAQGSTEIEMQINTNGSQGVGDFTIVLTEPNNPVSNPYESHFRIVTTDIQYIEVNDGGSSLDDLREARPNFASISREDYMQNNDKFDEVALMVWHTGPTGGINNEEATQIESMLKSGVHVFICGSGSLPALNLDAPGHSLLSVLGISWKQSNEIPLPFFTLVGIPGDPIGNDFVASSLSSSGYLLQAMDIDSVDKAFTVLKCHSNNKTITVRTVNDYARSIYLGFEPSIIEHDVLRGILFSRCMDWLEDKIDVDDSRHAESNSPFRISYDYIEEQIRLTTVDDMQNSDVRISLYDLQGNELAVIYQGRPVRGSMQFPWPSQCVARGLYFIHLQGEGYSYDQPVIR